MAEGDRDYWMEECDRLSEQIARKDEALREAQRFVLGEGGIPHGIGEHQAGILSKLIDIALSPSSSWLAEQKAKDELFDFFLYSRGCGHACPGSDCRYCFYGRMSEDERREIGYKLQNQWADIRKRGEPR